MCNAPFVTVEIGNIKTHRQKNETPPAYTGGFHWFRAYAGGLRAQIKTHKSSL